jgi:hypothetical protein
MRQCCIWCSAAALRLMITCSTIWQPDFAGVIDADIASGSL